MLINYQYKKIYRFILIFLICIYQPMEMSFAGSVVFDAKNPEKAEVIKTPQNISKIIKNYNANFDIDELSKEIESQGYQYDGSECIDSKYKSPSMPCFYSLYIWEATNKEKNIYYLALLKNLKGGAAHLIRDFSMTAKAGSFLLTTSDGDCRTQDGMTNLIVSARLINFEKVRLSRAWQFDSDNINLIELPLNKVVCDFHFEDKDQEW